MLYQDLFLELDAYEKQGVDLWLGESPASPYQVAGACCLGEDTSYMRDYIVNDGHISAIHFNLLPSDFFS